VSSSTFTKKLKVEELKVGMKVEFPKVYAIVKSIGTADRSGPTISGTVYLLELVGDSGPFKNKKPRLVVSGSDKLDVVYRHRWLVRVGIWLKERLVTAKKPLLGAMSTSG